MNNREVNRMKELKSLCTATLFLTAALVGTCQAQDLASGALAQKRVNQAAEVNNGTNPTQLSTKAGIQYQYSAIDSDLWIGTWEAYVGVPIGAKKNMAIDLKVTYLNGPFEKGYDFGDLSLKFTHVLDVNKSRGIAYTAELFFDTANRSDLGNGQTVLEMSAFYAKFLDGGSIIAPAWVQTVGLEGKGTNGTRINTSTIDFYYVPKLPNPKIFMTFDPAVSYDWETDEGFASLQVTLGLLTGKAFGGDSQVFIKPGIYAGTNRPLDYSVQIGYKVLSF